MRVVSVRSSIPSNNVTIIICVSSSVVVIVLAVVVVVVEVEVSTTHHPVIPKSHPGAVKIFFI